MNNAGVLNIEADSIESVVSALGQFVVSFGLKIIAAIIILIFGIWLSNKLTNGLKNVMEKRKIDASLQSFLFSFFNILLKIFVVIIVLTTVGVHMTSIIAVLGAASLAVGMALSGTLQNFAGGMVILMFKPFKVGDVIEIGTGETGTVKKIMIFTTELRTFDNQIIFLPNASLSNNLIKNLSRSGLKRNDLDIGVSYGTSIEEVRRIILNILKKDKRIINDPNAVVFVKALNDSAVLLTIRFWTRYEDAISVKAELLEKLYKILPSKKIKFPFQQLDVRMVK